MTKKREISYRKYNTLELDYNEDIIILINSDDDKIFNINIISKTKKDITLTTRQVIAFLFSAMTKLLLQSIDKTGMADSLTTEMISKAIKHYSNVHNNTLMQDRIKAQQNLKSKEVINESNKIEDGESNDETVKESK